MKLNEKQKILCTVGIFLVVCGGIGALNYLKLNERSKLLAQIDQYVTEENLATEKMRQIPVLREQRSKLINIIDQYAEILPREEHVQHDAFVEIIDNYRKDTKIVIQKAEYIKPRAVDRKPGSADKKAGSAPENFVRHRYRFKLLGTVPDFIEFVNKIENHTRFLKVDSISIKPVGVPGDEIGDDLGDSAGEDELEKASEPVKEIELTVSTYTYSKGLGKK